MMGQHVLGCVKFGMRNLAVSAVPSILTHCVVAQVSSWHTEPLLG